MKKQLLSIILISFLTNVSFGQAIWENSNANVYPFLSRLSQKGLVEFNDIIQPQTRTCILKSLQDLKEKVALLSQVEKLELHFYLQEFDTIQYKENKESISFFKKDLNKRWRTFKVKSKEFEINADPILGIKSMIVDKNKIQQISNGFELWGSIGTNKKWAFELYYRDYTETGDVAKYDRINNTETGIILVGNNTKNQTNYSEIRGNISYAFKNGLISLGKDHITWGYGENGKIVLSDKAPSFPYIRLDYTPNKWLHFNYFNAWLNSNIIDSNATYNTHTGGVMGDIRYFYLPKFMASHSITLKPIKGLDIAIGESIVYSDRMDIGFLLPINLFKIYDNNKSNYLINAGSNGQYFLQVNSRNHIKNTHLYSSLFIDEIKVSAIFDKKQSRNQLGYTVGGSVTDIFTNYLTAGAEYTRVNPFVYTNLIPAQSYTQYDYQLGDWMGNNFDRIIIFSKYTPIPKLNLYARFQKTRKGGSGTIFQQYLVQPLPSFLFDFQKQTESIFIKATYEWINNLYFLASIENVQNSYNNGTNYKYNKVQIGFSYGLN